jgi:formylglycine-generating enzyme required for sulfatase activity
MEYAIRAEALTSRYFGEPAVLLEKYAWFVPNSGGRAGPVGRLKPNDFGLFDMHGNVWCWCQETYKPYPQEQRDQVFQDKECDLEINPQEERVLRGDCFTDQERGVRSASRWHSVPTKQTNIIGFRLARTITP